MHRIVRRVSVLLAVSLVLGVASACGGSSSNGPPPPPPGTVRVLYLHHSTGGVIWGGGVPEFFTAYNAAHGTTYEITELAYPNSPYPWENYPYDYWNLWVAHTGADRVDDQPTLDELAQNADVIVWKHCFPVGQIEASSAPGDVTSSTKTIANYQAQYQALKTRMRQFSDKKFIVWTGAALRQQDTNADAAGRASQFFTWVKETWDTPGDNIFVWDFWQLETGGGLYLLPANASGDSHPNDTFAVTAAPLIGQRIVDVIEGRGDSGSLTGE